MKCKKISIAVVIIVIALLAGICLDYNSPRSKFFRSLLKRGVGMSFDGEYDMSLDVWYFQIRSRLGLFSTLTTPSMSFSELDLSGFDFDELRIIHEKYHICLARTNLSDSQLKTICQFINIRALDISGCKNITDEGIREIVNLENLEWIDFSGTQCTDAGVVLLKDMPKLRGLCLDHTRVVGSCFATNDGWKNLRALHLVGCKLKDDIFDSLSNIDLRALTLSLNENNELPPNIENILKNKYFHTLRTYGKDFQEVDLPEEIQNTLRNKPYIWEENEQPAVLGPI